MRCPPVRLFRGDTSAVIFDAILNRALVAPVRLNPSLPPELERIINKALQKDRELRCQSAAELRADLKRLKREIDSGKSATVAVTAAASGAAGAIASPVSTATFPVAEASPRPWRRRAMLAVAVVALLAVLAGAGWFYRSRVGGGETINSLAVLPFVNSSDDPSTEYLSDGITESLINSLSQLPKLEVKSRDSAFHYKGKDPEAETVGRELGVRAIFKGRVTQVGDNLPICQTRWKSIDGEGGNTCQIPTIRRANRYLLSTRKRIGFWTFYCLRDSVLAITREKK
jgi:hypothetical protein